MSYIFDAKRLYKFCKCLQIDTADCTTEVVYELNINYRAVKPW